MNKSYINAIYCQECADECADDEDHSDDESHNNNGEGHNNIHCKFSHLHSDSDKNSPHGFHF